MKHCVLLLTIIQLWACSNTSSTALGSLERERIALTATANELLVSISVEQGEFVKAGRVLAKLDDRMQQSVVELSAANVAQAEATLDKLRHGARKEEVAASQAQVAAQRAILLQTEQNLDRIQKLMTQNVESQTNLDVAKAKRDTASANLRTAQEQLLALTNGTRDEDLRVAESVLRAAQAILSAENKRLADLTIVATRDGIVDSLPWNVGERVTVGSPLVIMLAGDAPYARVYVPEPKRAIIVNGTVLTVHIDGIQDTFQGEVFWVSIDPAFTPHYALNQEERSHLMYLCKIQLPDAANKLPSGVPVQVDLP